MVQFNGEIGQGIFFQSVFLYYLKYIFAKFTQLTHLLALRVYSTNMRIIWRDEQYVEEEEEGEETKLAGPGWE